ncbi:pyrroline-5-carboxylate reductase family protein [Paracoccus actinidiae]|uniref:pyrroline-5-carboxylate reductase family protein n=1 Tax=Paracoccus actinidiae TaxID=3064531 RepID=UPI0027D21B66|nr:pyrroline-5-carboxylate reductase dimerization domain-containing protein [Paracoccus sp. M09]
MPDERQIEYSAGVSGTGPAYLALLADALRKHAIANGIAPEIARNAVNAMLIGTGRLVEAQGRCPSDIVGDFLAYQGMTTAALESMMDAGLDRIVSDGVEAALKRHENSNRVSATP